MGHNPKIFLINEGISRENSLTLPWGDIYLIAHFLTRAFTSALKRAAGSGSQLLGEIESGEEFQIIITTDNIQHPTFSSNSILAKTTIKTGLNSCQKLEGQSVIPEISPTGLLPGGTRLRLFCMLPCCFLLDCWWESKE